MDPWAEPWEPVESTGPTCTAGSASAADAVGEAAGSAVAGREARARPPSKVSDAAGTLTEKVADATEDLTEKVADATDAAKEKVAGATEAGAKKATTRRTAKPADATAPVVVDTDAPPAAEPGDRRPAGPREEPRRGRPPALTPCPTRTAPGPHGPGAVVVCA